jgi:hypothetical protein
MKIELSKEEYLTMLELLEMANWVLYAHDSDDNPDKGKYRAFEQRILAYAKEAGFGNLIEYVEKLDEYLPTREFEETSPGMGYVKEFENDNFWDELIERMAMRDLLRQEGEKKAAQMTFEDMLRKLQPFQEKYGNEFETHGLDNLTIVES